MKRLHADIGALQPALEKTPEVLHAIGVDLPIHIALSVVDDRMGIFVQPFVGLQFIAIDGRSGFDMLTDVSLDSGAYVGSGQR